MTSLAMMIEELDKSGMKTDLPSFRTGDTVAVQIEVTEGTRKRIQTFEGVVIAKRNRGINSSFLVRKKSHNGEGVEGRFLIHSPAIKAIEVKRLGDVRRAKLYDLRHRTGKAARIKERLPAKKEKS